jgi:hypothetical protein
MRISGQSILAGALPHLVREGRDPVVFQGLNEGGGEAMIGYSFPALLIDHAMRNPHVPPGFWRGVNLNQNAIYLECFIDEIAHATKQDRLALRRKLMANHPKHLAVLNAAAERAGWARPAPDVGGQKVFRGLAQTHGFGSYVAACAEVSVSREGALKIHRIVAATDCRQPAADRGSDRRLVRLRPGRGAVPGVHGQGRRHRAEELRHLPVAEDRSDAQGGVRDHALGRLLGGCGRAHYRGGGPGRAERHIRGHRQAHP